MSLLREIQEALIQPGHAIGPILLKLRLLASRLGSGALEQWVKYEAEGYPQDAELPGYRKLPVSYIGHFSGPFGSGIQNAPIPPYLIEKFAGKHWTLYELRQSVAAIDNLITGDDRNGTFSIEASNLILLLQGKIYPDYACNGIDGTISKSCLVALQNAVRTKILELTIQLEQSIPEAAAITLGPPAAQSDTKEKELVTRITQQIVHGNVHGNLTALSDNAKQSSLTLNIQARDNNAFVKALVDAGIPEPDACELGEIVRSEEPESKEEPFGTKAKAWIGRNIKKAADGTWNVGIAVATKLLTEAAMKYYDLK